MNRRAAPGSAVLCALVAGYLGAVSCGGGGGDGGTDFDVAGVSARPVAGSPSDLDATIRVVRVIDGDTVELENGERVRLIGIDTPELDERSRASASQMSRATTLFSTSSLRRSVAS